MSKKKLILYKLSGMRRIHDLDLLVVEIHTRQQKQQKTFSALNLKGVMARHGEIARVNWCPLNFMEQSSLFTFMQLEISKLPEIHRK